MYDELSDHVDFFVVYIAEAHTIDGWQTDSNDAEGIRVRQPTALEERGALARRCAEALGLTIPTLVDRMDDAACEAYSAWPERIYLLDSSGRVAYRGGPGPYEFRPEEAREALFELLRLEREA